MTSILGTQSIQHPNGTASMTVASTGAVTFATPPTNAGSMIKLFSGTISSIQYYDNINSTYITTTYDKYKIYYYVKPATDNQDFRVRFYVSGSIVDASSTYSYETTSMNGTSQTNEGNDHIQINYEAIGNGSGEGHSGFIELQNVNNASFPTSLTGLANNYKDGTHSLHYFGGAFKRANYASVVNGLRFYMSSGDIADGTIHVYGIKE